MDPVLTSNGEPYGPKRLQELIRQRYLISKFIHTSYTEVGEMSPTERESLILLIQKDVEADAARKKQEYEQMRSATR